MPLKRLKRKKIAKIGQNVSNSIRFWLQIDSFFLYGSIEADYRAADPDLVLSGSGYMIFEIHITRFMIPLLQKMTHDFFLLWKKMFLSQFQKRKDIFIWSNLWLDKDKEKILFYQIILRVGYVTISSLKMPCFTRGVKR